MRFFSKLALAAAAALVFSGPVFANAPLQVGQPAPAFTVTDINGKTHRLADFKGKTVVLEWTNALCPFVVKHYDTGNMQKVQADATKAGVVWISVNSGAPGKQGHVTAAQAKAKLAGNGAKPTAYVIDDKGVLGRQFDARTTPHLFVINPSGQLAYMGAIDDKPTARKDDVAGATNYVRTAIAAISAGKAPDPASTKPYGCSVKY
jgi:peroxiredoxin